MLLRAKNKNKKISINSVITIISNAPDKLLWNSEKLVNRPIFKEPVYWYIKRLLDVILCLMLLPVAVPVILLACIVIKIDSSGPVFLYQMRTGKGGKRFKMYRLRTMSLHAKEIKKYLFVSYGFLDSEHEFSNNLRFTKIGDFLQRYNIDELPQIFNVLRGEMSLVGPRPTSISSNNYEIWQTERLEVKPGLTGLWQISGCNQNDFNERLRLDIAYIRNQNLLLDVQILIRTVGYIFKRHHEY